MQILDIKRAHPEIAHIDLARRIEDALATYPQITHAGWHGGGSLLTSEDVPDILSAIDALLHLDPIPIKTCRVSSELVRECVENYQGCACSHGVAIIACIALGIPFRAFGKDSVVGLGISHKSLKSMYRTCEKARSARVKSRLNKNQNMSSEHEQKLDCA